MLQMFSIFDVKVQAFMTPMFMRSQGEAIRSFGDACADEGHQFAKHAEDFVLYYLGDWEESDGTFELVEPQAIAKAIQFVGGDVVSIDKKGRDK